MIAIILGILALTFGIVGALSDDKTFHFLMKYATLITILLAVFQIGVSYGFGSAISALLLMFIMIFLFMLIMDLVGLIPIVLNVMKRRR